MLNRDIYSKDPKSSSLLNNGVAEVNDDFTEQALKTLRYELETFVCDGEYEKGLNKILSTFLTNIENNREQVGFWISGFYGSGKSHLAKMLRVLWTNFQFPDGTEARSLIQQLPIEIHDHLKALASNAKKHGGLHAASGTLGAGAGDKVRLALLGIIFRSVGLPEQYHLARFVLWLKSQGIYDAVKTSVEKAGKEWLKEISNLFMSSVIQDAVLQAKPDVATNRQELKELLKSEFKRVEDVSNDQMIEAITDALSTKGKMPLTLVVLDEVQQYIGDDGHRAYLVQEMAETCAKHFKGTMLLVGTGQNALSGTPSLAKLMARFPNPVQLSDADVESVIRKIILSKKSSAKRKLEELLMANLGQISKLLSGSKIAHTADDELQLVADYPILPARRRFWERVLRVIDRTGTGSQLRSQLRIIHEAVCDTAEQSLGHVVPGDYIYRQIASNLLQTGEISQEIYELIQKLSAENAHKQLQARVLSLVYMIGKLPTEVLADAGIRATATMIADLLIEDITHDNASLRKAVQTCLDELTHDGKVMALESPAGTEFRLQTQESSQWHDTYRTIEHEIQNNHVRIETERADLMQRKFNAEKSSLKLLHGKSKEPRTLEVIYGGDFPASAKQSLCAWVQDGWSTEVKSVISEAKAAGPDSPVLYVFIPTKSLSTELAKAIVTYKAADQTLQIRGVPTTPEGKDARAAMETRRRDAEKLRDHFLKEIFDTVQVFQGGGNEIDGASLKEKLEAGTQVSLKRLYKEFSVSDDEAWGKVYERARKDGGQNALELVHHKDEPAKHPVCAELIKYIGSGKKGTEIRTHFASPPFGWNKDAIDGGLYVLLANGDLRARDPAQKEVDAKSLDRSALTHAYFTVENITLSTPQRLRVRKLLAEFVGCNPNEEETKAAQFLAFAKEQASQAGGAKPRPEPPNVALLEQIAAEVGNARLVKLYENADVLTTTIQQWQAAAKQIQARVPAWTQLCQLITLSCHLGFHAELEKERLAIEEGRLLLDEPDPVQHLLAQASDKLRKAVVHQQQQFGQHFAALMQELEADGQWQALQPDQRTAILAKHGLKPLSPVTLTHAEDVILQLEECSISQWEDRTAALSNKFDKARQEAAELLMPKVQRVHLPGATFQSEADVKAWLQQVEKSLLEKLKDGPVII